MVCSVVGKIKALQKRPCLIPVFSVLYFLYVTLQSKRDFADTIKDLKIWVIEVGH